MMPNNEDEWIDELLDGFSLGTVLPDRTSAVSFDEAKATIQAKLLEARLDALMAVRLRSIFTAREEADRFIVMELERYQAELQASAPTKKGEDHA